MNCDPVAFNFVKNDPKFVLKKIGKGWRLSGGFHLDNVAREVSFMESLSGLLFL